jgi:hypothetical protein
MKPTAALRYRFSVFATTSCRGLSFSRKMLMPQTHVWTLVQKWLITLGFLVGVIGSEVSVSGAVVKRVPRPIVIVGQASAVAYGHVITSPRPCAVIDEIWKGALHCPVHVGTTVPIPIADGTFDHVLLCYAPRPSSHLLSLWVLFPVRHGGVGSPTVALAELKALCVAKPST